MMKNDISNRVKGGRSALSTIPWQVYLEVKYDRIKKTVSNVCGGTILNERTILTAAHCFLDGTDPKTGKSTGKVLFLSF